MLSKVRHGDKKDLADDLREVFRTGQKDYTRERAWDNWVSLCVKWGKHYRSIKRMAEDDEYKYYFTYLFFHPKIHAMIYTTNWIERLQKDFRRVLKMRGAMPNEESVLVLMGKVAMDKNCYNRQLPAIDSDKKLFPSEDRKRIFSNP